MYMIVYKQVLFCISSILVSNLKDQCYCAYLRVQNRVTSFPPGRKNLALQPPQKSEKQTAFGNAEHSATEQGLAKQLTVGTPGGHVRAGVKNITLNI